ncbi:MAG: hypothetical protein DRR04_13455 [Gammaproteobacteria bacterium]|nr:MAG: hypothetical protein DRR04_13455 [Gammaproteobacteria bacterium]
MKIIYDKINTEEQHAVSTREIKRLFKIIPKDWISKFNTVHFSNQYPENSRFDRPVILSEVSNRLMVCSRGIPAEKIIEEILIELVQRHPSHKNLRAHYANRLDGQQLKKIHRVIDPYLEQYKKESQPPIRGCPSRD